MTVSCIMWQMCNIILNLNPKFENEKIKKKKQENRNKKRNKSKSTIFDSDTQMLEMEIHGVGKGSVRTSKMECITYYLSISNTFESIMNNNYLSFTLSKTSIQVDISFQFTHYF